METLLVNGIIGFWLIVFGAMAMFPLLTSSKADARHSTIPAEDQVISVVPMLAEPMRRPVLVESPAPVAFGSNPDHQRAA